MSKHLIEFTTDKRFIRRMRELKTIEIMVRMYCQHHHRGAPLCVECAELFDYAQRRLQRCVFGDAKPNCAKCVVHCYNAAMRENIRVVMRWGGPRMLLRHPILGIRHLIADHRPVPVLLAKRLAADPALNRNASAGKDAKTAEDSVSAGGGNSATSLPPT